MISNQTRSGNSDTEEMKPGPFIDIDGRHHLPVGTFQEMLHRARFGNPPEPWGENTQEKFVATLKASPIFRQIVRGVLSEE